MSDSDSERSDEVLNDLQKVKSKFEELSAIAKECDSYLKNDEKKYNSGLTRKYLNLILIDIPNFRDDLGKALEKSKKSFPMSCKPGEITFVFTILL